MQNNFDKQAIIDKAQHLAGEALLTHLPITFYWLNKEGVFQGCNERELKDLHIDSMENFVGKHALEIISENAWKHSQKVMQENKTLTFPETHRFEDGKEIHYISIKSPLHDDSGNVIGLLGLSINITTEKEAEQLRFEKAIFDENLRMLRKQVETLRSQAHTIAHELKTPLGAIQFNAKGLQQLSKTEVDDTKKSRLNRIYENITAEIAKTRMFIDIILGNVKDLKEVALKPTSIKHCVDEAVQRYPYEDESEQTKIKSLDIKDFTFHGNDELMIHVLFNLIKNSLYFIAQMHKGEISIWTSTDKHNNYLHFKDTAKGISEDELKQIFNEFYTGTDIGTGVGLFFCRRAMQTFNGDIQCQSKLGSYAEFIMVFPILTDSST